MSSSIDRPTRDLLTRAGAEARAAQVHEVDYQLRLDLRSGQDAYDGDATISMRLRDVARPLALDFVGQVLSLEIDGVASEPDHRGHQLWLSPRVLRERMEVRIRYHNAFDHTGDGFHRFVDPEDRSEYVYSNFQPYAAHRMFPCLDQPDLKARYQVTVGAPADWEVVSAARVESVEGLLEDGRRLHRFERTPRFSTYLLAVVAGPYHVVRGEHQGLALGLYGRRSMARILEHDAEELLEVTRQGFDFYRALFDQPYPFTKYDQLFMPEFNAGAMENVGAVTFHDGYLFRDPPTDTQRLERAEVVLHELAHMWFGDLVTMRWWDDLWLNESFATYVSFLALDRATRFHQAWQRFNGAMKPAAYRQDQLVTTHPIAADAPDTDAALLNFDGITYEKGASVLKQLSATLGEETFAAGLRRYFVRHAWGNATLADFLAALESAAGRSLGGWADAWLGTASLNTVGAMWSASDGAIERLVLDQEAPPSHPWLRPHAMDLAFVHAAQGELVTDTVRVSIDGPETIVPAAVGRPTPLLVFPNHGDHDYAKVVLDPVSLAFARERMPELADPFLRQMLWTALWDMVRDALLPSTEYFAMCRRMAPSEPDPEVVDATLDRAVACLRSYVPEALCVSSSSALVETALSVLRSGIASDLRITWLRAAIATAATRADLDALLDLADGRERIADVELDQEMRWSLAIRAVAFGLDDGEDRVAAETARDRSDRGERAVIKAQAARPGAAAKREAWRRIHDEGYGSFYLTRAAMQGFRWHHQRELLAPYDEAFFERVRGVFAAHDHPFARAYLVNLFPATWAEPWVLERAQTVLRELDPSERTLERHLRESIDELERIRRVRAFAERAGAG